MQNEFSEAEIAAVDWGGYRTSIGDASQIPGALRGLISSRSETVAWRHYWEIENRVFVQGRAFDSAVPVVGVLTASLLDDPSDLALDLIVEAVLQIVTGSTHEDEVARGAPGVVARCRDRAREGLWLYRREAKGARREEVEAIVEAIERGGEQ